MTVPTYLKLNNGSVANAAGLGMGNAALMNLSSSNTFANSIFTNYAAIATNSSVSSASKTMQTLTNLSIAGAIFSGLGAIVTAAAPFFKKSAATAPKADPNTTEAKTNATEVNKAIADYNKNGNVDGLKAEVAKEAECKAQASTIENMTVEPQKNYDSLDGQVKTLNDQKTTADGELKSLKTDEGKAETGYKDAKTAYDKAKSDDPNKATLYKNMVTAKQLWDTAKNTRAKKEDQITGLVKQIGETKTKLSAAGTALETAKSEQTAARKANQSWAASIENAKQVLTKGGYEVATKKPEEAKTETEKPAWKFNYS